MKKIKRYKSFMKESVIPTTIQIGKKYQSIDGNGYIEVINIYIDRFHLNSPEIYIEFSWFNSEAVKKGISTQSLSSFKKTYFMK